MGDATTTTTASADTATAAATAATAQATATPAQAAAATSSTATTPADAVKGKDAANPGEAAASTEAKPADAAKAEDAAKAAAAETSAEKDEIAAALANLNRETRAARSAKERHESELAKVADKVAAAERLEKAQAALKGKDFLSALTSIDPEMSVDEAILTLIDQAKQRDAQPMSKDDIERIAKEQFAAQQKAAEEKAKADADAALERSSDIYVQACDQAFKSGEYKLIAEFGVTRDQIKEFAESSYAKDRSVPSPEETMKHFEQDYQRKLERAGYSKAQIAAIKEGEAAGSPDGKQKAQTPTSPVPDTRGSAEEPTKTQKHETMAEYDRRVKAQLRALRGNAAQASR